MTPNSRTNRVFFWQAHNTTVTAAAPLLQSCLLDAITHFAFAISSCARRKLAKQQTHSQGICGDTLSSLLKAVDTSGAPVPHQFAPLEQFGVENPLIDGRYDKPPWKYLTML